MTETVVDRRYRVTIPKDVRRRLGIRPGSALEAKGEKGCVILTPARQVKSPTERLWGLARGILEADPKKAARKAIALRRD